MKEVNAISFSEARCAILEALRGSGKSEKEVSELTRILDSDTGKLIIAAVIAATNKR